MSTFSMEEVANAAARLESWSIMERQHRKYESELDPDVDYGKWIVAEPWTDNAFFPGMDIPILQPRTERNAYPTNKEGFWTRDVARTASLPDPITIPNIPWRAQRAQQIRRAWKNEVGLPDDPVMFRENVYKYFFSQKLIPFLSDFHAAIYKFTTEHSDLGPLEKLDLDILQEKIVRANPRVTDIQLELAKKLWLLYDGDYDLDSFLDWMRGDVHERDLPNQKDPISENYAHVGYFGTPFTNPLSLQTAVLINSENVLQQLLINELPHLAKLITRFSFGAFHKFIAMNTPTEQSVWISRGSEFINRLPKPLRNFKFQWRGAVGKHSARRNIVIEFSRFIMKNREAYPELPAITLNSLEFDDLEDAALEFPDTGNEILYQFLRTQPAGLIYIQELISEIIGNLSFSMTFKE